MSKMIPKARLNLEKSHRPTVLIKAVVFEAPSIVDVRYSKSRPYGIVSKIILNARLDPEKAHRPTILTRAATFETPRLTDVRTPKSHGDRTVLIMKSGT